MTSREIHKKQSNNPKNNNKNICGLKVAEKLGVAHTVHYLHKMSDLVRASRNRFTVRSRKSSLKGNTVGSIRKEIAQFKCKYFIVRVPGHVLLLDGQGNTIIDTAPRKKDKRKITHAYAVWDK